MRSTDRYEAFTSDVVDHVEHSEALTVDELVMDKIQRPARVRTRLDQDWRRCPDGLALHLSLAHRQAFLAVEPVDSIDARRRALAAQQHEQTPLAESQTFIGRLTNTISQLRVRSTLRLIAEHLAIRANDPTGPLLRQNVTGPKVCDRFALHGGLYHFFATRSFIAARSSICFSFAFSSSSTFSRLASDTVMLPNLAFQL
ncbi:hypothetical protein A6024_07020 [Rhodovulum sulfidophilum]|nr:hypothetical protein A6W98_07165 [Rhodovulum sulfidophilum DSM 1374]ANB37697.1 hypothetical protein A6024_07020 [Rhodovulum sulfidophilum]